MVISTKKIAKRLAMGSACNSMRNELKTYAMGIIR